MQLSTRGSIPLTRSFTYENEAKNALLNAKVRTESHISALKRGRGKYGHAKLTAGVYNNCCAGNCSQR